jgi:hypothetical protein
MKSKFLCLALSLFLAHTACGCAPLIVVSVAAGALGGYAASKDTIQGESDKAYESLWNAAFSVSKIRGNVKFEDSIKGYIEADIESSKVYIKLIRLTQATTRIRVSARKYHLPNLSLAQDMFVKIMEEAK